MKQENVKQESVKPENSKPENLKQRTVLVVVAVILVAVMIYLGARQAGKGYKPFPNRANSAAPGVRPENLLGKAAPEFELASLDGKTVHLSDFRGQAVLVNFWATWCGPCKVEMPWFVELQKQYGPQGLTILGIAMDDSGKETIASFAKEIGVNYPILLGKESVGDNYGGVIGLPTSFFIDRSGKVVEHYEGLVSRSEIEEGIKESLGAGKAAAAR